MASWRLQLSVSQGVIGHSCGCWPHNRCFSARAHFAEEKTPFNQNKLRKSDHDVSKLAGSLLLPSDFTCSRISK
ncbi:hypothetical protein GOP47_0029437 [Adiantum capillus-veneris]|nr:hypothetical protein GOP47_0029437 [Adiantum capillus-veneris]